jgi:hypothetical protein
LQRKSRFENDNDIFTHSFSRIGKDAWHKKAALKNLKPCSPRTDVVLSMKVPTTSVKTLPQTGGLLPIEVPTMPIENFPQAIVILPIEAPTTPVDTFAQTDELLPIEVSTTPVSSLYPKQTKFCPLPLGAIITALV